MKAALTVPTPDDVDALIDSLRAIRLTDYPRTVELAEHAAGMAREIGYTAGLVRSLNYLAWGYNRQNHFAKAVKPAQEALILARQDHLLEEEGYALLSISLCYEFSSQREESMKALLRQLEIGEQIGNGELVLSAHSDLGETYRERREFERAAWHFERALSAARTMGSSDMIAFPLLNYAYLLFSQGNIERAIALAQEAYDSASEHHFTHGIVYALCYLAEFQIAQSNLDGAVETLARTDLKTPEIQRARSQLAAARGETDEAIRLLLETANSQQGLTSELLQCYQELSRLYAAQKDYAQAYYYCLERAILQERYYAEQITSRIEVVGALYEVEALRRELDERKLTENERMERERAEIELQKQRQLDAIREHLLTRLAHEFRTPLTVLRTSFDLLTRYADRLTPERRDMHIAKIDPQFKQIERLLDNILDVLRAEENSAGLYGKDET